MKEGCETVLAGFALPAATGPWAAALDSRLRGNDRAGCLLMPSLKLAPTRVGPGVCRGAVRLRRMPGLWSPASVIPSPNIGGPRGADEVYSGASWVAR